MSAFEDLGVLPEIIQAVEELDWTLPTPIQAEAIPLILGGGDVLAAAETGSGKTGAFALPILQITYETLNNKAVVNIPIEEKKQDEQEQESASVKWNLNDRDKDLAIDGLVCQSRSPDWSGVRATKGISSGKYYYEATVRDEGLCRVGWALKKSTRNIGTDKFSWGYGGTGKKSTESKFVDYGKPFGTNDVIGCYIDFDQEIMGFTKNGENFGTAFQFNSKLGIFYPALLLKNAEMGFNFGESPMKHQLSGFKPLSEAELLEESNVVVPTTTNNDKKKNNNNKKQQKQQEQNDNSSNINKKRTPLSLIIEPTRELADQTYSAILNFSKYLLEPKIEVSLCIGGFDTKRSAGSADGDIVIGTPGRLESLVKEGAIDLTNIKFFVLDEADQLIDENLAIVNFIYNKLPINNLQVLFFSATLHSPKVVKFCEQITKNPTWVDLKGKDFIPDLITHAYVKADPEAMQPLWRDSGNPLRMKTDGVHNQDVKEFGKLKTDEQKSEAIKLLKAQLLLKVIKSFNMDQAIIFARTRLDCDHVYEFLNAAGGRLNDKALEGDYPCAVLHSDKATNVRKENLEKFKSGEIKFLICTDVAARGIDVRGLPFVINYTLPDNFEDYIHRVGRVGRADRIGLAVSIIGAHQEKVWYHINCRNKGKGCFNTDLVEQRGCCIWYDEPSLFQPMLENLGPVELNAEFKLPEHLAESKFGNFKDRNAKKHLEYQPHTEQLKSRVIELAHLEETIQVDFLSLPKRVLSKVDSMST
ncbi:hypothetical protein CYY_003447 [Polysphondylium violaceum]|uniref:ATP-dependent RNA helicase n=1 Tax=Polysphondylium violaceum TaxID=133409 RepID=A0A8J4PYE0_9MYCE|nr:hypothetical protein CYY_003447 [Polysphondylium violaceum]